MPRRVMSHVRAAAFSCLVAVLLPVSLAEAHHRVGGSDDRGIPIPALTHGQMAVIAAYRGEILALAARQSPTDEAFRRLLTFGDIQYTYCLWGLVPGSLGDESSPFNECSHAYLSTAQALLTHMRAMNTVDSPLHADIEALISRIDADMVRNGASFVLCQFSGEDFNTAGLIRPDWAAVPFHLPSVSAFAGLAAMLGLGTMALARKPTKRQAR